MPTGWRIENDRLYADGEARSMRPVASRVFASMCPNRLHPLSRSQSLRWEAFENDAEGTDGVVAPVVNFACDPKPAAHGPLIGILVHTPK